MDAGDRSIRGSDAVARIGPGAGALRPSLLLWQRDQELRRHTRPRRRSNPEPSSEPGRKPGADPGALYL